MIIVTVVSCVTWSYIFWGFWVYVKQEHTYTCISKHTYAWFPSAPLVTPYSSDDPLPCNVVLHLQKLKACYVILANNNVCTLTEIFRKAAQVAALSFCQCCLGLIFFSTESKLAFPKILSELKINPTVKNSRTVTGKFHIRNGYILFID